MRGSDGRRLLIYRLANVGVDVVMNRGGRRMGGAPRYVRAQAADPRQALPRPTPTLSAVPPFQWQTIALALGVPSGSVTGEFVYVPEGCVTIVRCDCCGGRREWLSDFRNTDAVTLERRGRVIIDTYWPAFVREHRSCTPPSVERPALAIAVAESRVIVNEARRRVMSGQSFHSKLVAFTSRGRREFVLPDLPPLSENHGDDHRRAIAEWHYGVRTLFRSEGVQVHGMVLAQLAWASSDPGVMRGTLTPGEAPDRNELLLITVLTHEAAHVALVDLQASPDEGISMDNLSWQAVRAPSLLLDGMIARPAVDT